MARQPLLYLLLCEEAYQRKGNIGKKPNPVACAECESTCMYGMELLQTIDEDEFRELLCGSDCNTCRQPCNLRRIAYMRGIVWQSRLKVKMRKHWLKVALRPYYERNKGDGKHEADLL